MLALLIAHSLAPHALTIARLELNAVAGAMALADDAAPVTERCPVAPVTIRSGCYLASGLTVQLAA